MSFTNEEQFNKLRRVRDETLEAVSPSFCIAKWTQSTIYLFNGHTHSCHHPNTHKIRVEDIKRNPAALHNTPDKQERRLEMLAGTFPTECDYCWRTERRGKEHLSDRTYKSASSWSLPRLPEVLASGAGPDFRPSYVEVAFENTCFSRDTRFVTSNGIKSFNDFNDGDGVTILGERTWVPATVRKFGRQRLWKLTLGRGNHTKEYYTTKNHRWITIKSSGNSRIQVDKMTSELSVGDVIRKFPTSGRLKITTPCNVGIMHGLVFGDGNRQGSCNITLFGQKVQFRSLFTTGNVGKITGSGNKAKCFISGLPWNWKELPSLEANSNYLLGFIMGWLATDGSISQTGNNIVVYNEYEKNLQWLESASATLGIFTRGIRRSCRKSPFNEKSQAILHNLEFFADSLFPEFFLKEEHRRRFALAESKERRNIHSTWKVREIQETSRVETVWCVVEPENEVFTLDSGVSTRNCNFKCVYCMPHISSRWWEEIESKGPYNLQGGKYHSLEFIDSTEKRPIRHDEPNPYIDAFWKIWPEWYNTLHTFRITGGEPLLSKHTWKILDYVIEHPNPNIILAINTNLSVPDKLIQELLKRAPALRASIKSFQVYTSLESTGAQAEYSRFGMDYIKFIRNCELVLDAFPRIDFMTTVNILSASTFIEFLNKVLDLRHKYNAEAGTNRVGVMVNYLRYPEFLDMRLLPEFTKKRLTDGIESLIEKSMVDRTDYKNTRILYLEEVDQLRRLLAYMNSKMDDADKQVRKLRDYVAELDNRRETSFLHTFPELFGLVNAA